MSHGEHGGHAVEVHGPVPDAAAHVLSPEALAFVAGLHGAFEDARRDLLSRRGRIQADFDGGRWPGPDPDRREIRDGDWTVAPAPPVLEDRRVEITGPVDRKMMINALNSGAQVFMADFEDALSPTWENVLAGQVNCFDAVRRELTLTTETKEYRLSDDPAVLMVRPRGWHLPEAHVTIGGSPVSASLFDFGLYFFHNARELLARGAGPYFYLPKLESADEAGLWNQVFVHAQEELGIPQGSVRATVLIETVTAAFAMDDILWRLRDHAAGLNAGRWDYLFSLIKKLHSHPFYLPDRSRVTMAVPFMDTYARQLVAACHRHGAHAIGGMAAFIPSRKDPEVTERALRKVREDKEREASAGFDGTWVAHPDLVPVAREVFDRHLGARPHQKGRFPSRLRSLDDDARTLLDFHVEGGRVTEDGVRDNVSVALQYLNAWLGGWGAAAIWNLMEDTATAEIARSQLWQWRARQAKLDDGQTFDGALYRKLRDEELEKLGGRDTEHYAQAVEILDELVESETFVPFLTDIAYERLVDLTG